MRTIAATVFFITMIGSVLGQEVSFDLQNGSFEDIPHKGGGIFDIGIRGWYDCGELQFPNETPPDVHPVNAWQVTMPPADGNTYLGMVIRDNDSWESISQRLRYSLEKDKCYEISVDLARSDYYVSASRLTNRTENYTDPAVLRIWGGNGVCGRIELLSQSDPVNNDEWQTYQFSLKPASSIHYLTLEAFYQVPVLFPYNGHVLLDNISSIIQVPCNVEEELAFAEVEMDSEEIAYQPIPISSPPSVDEALVDDNTNRDASAEVIAKDDKRENQRRKILEELNAETVEEGQIIQVNNIYFAADSSRIEEQSAEVIDEIYKFLRDNKNIVVEIGGHTSTVPSHSYCDDLSTKRAKEVVHSLMDRGIPSEQLSYKGYGKRKPLVPNDKFDMDARKRNQRVEIKILSLSS